MSPQTRQHAPDEDTEPDTSSTGKTPTSTATGKKPHAIWTSADDETLVTILEKATEDGERGDNGWKKPAWTAAARALANPSVGGVKSADGCREHWTKQLVKDYNQVHTLITTISGFGWSEERGVVTAEDAVWDELIKSNPRLKKWRTKRFPLFTRIGSLLDGSQAQGKDTVRVPQAPPKAASSPSPSNTGTPTSSMPRTPTRGRTRSPDQSPAQSRSDSIESSPPRPQRGKHARSPSSSPVRPSGSTKRGRVTGPVAVNNVADALSLMASSFHAADAAIATPTRRSKAVKTVSTDASLSQRDRVKAIRLFTQDIALCDSYLAIDDKGMRNDFLSDVLSSD